MNKINKLKDIKKVDDEDKMCAICYEDIHLEIELKCKHTFCFLCIKAYKIKINVNILDCPMCRTKIDWTEVDKIVKDYENNSKYKWLFQGRNFGWWEYEKEQSDEIEIMYNKYNKNIQNKEDNEKYKLVICSNIYEIDFKDMLQINISNNSVREIKRIKNDDSNEDIFIKGVAGLKVT